MTIHIATWRLFVEEAARELLQDYPHWRTVYGGREIDYAIEAAASQLITSQNGHYTVYGYTVCMDTLYCTCENHRKQNYCFHLLAVVFWAVARQVQQEFEIEWETWCAATCDICGRPRDIHDDGECPPSGEWCNYCEKSHRSPSECKIVYGGYRYGYRYIELRRAFDAVADPSDWKAPIKAEVEYERWPITVAAIEFFTATQATVHANNGRCHIEAPGYRLGPAGDH